MRARFFDRQDRNNPHEGMMVSDSRELLMWLDEMRNRSPFFCELVGENGFNLLLGISATFGCAQYSASDGSPPYWMAMDNAAENNDEFMEFLIANTDTPVSMRFCMPIERIKIIAVDFLENGERSKTVTWEEI